jgi:tetratricopeptide (TPR) repeat protein/tRNA A-37 threonylcarbamoyl transferase component Bud32
MLGHFEVVRQIGRGGMGEVYSARDRDLDRTVAIKVLRADTFNSEERRARFRREAQTLAKIIHPNVVTVFEVGEQQGRLFIAMELVEGQTLAEWLASAKRPWTEIVPIFLQAGRGLTAAHAQGFVHRDFKPENVFVGEDGRVRVGDFGVVGLVGSIDTTSGGVSSPASQLTLTGSVLGTPHYMSPEQHRGTTADPRTDQFAFAASLYRAVFRRTAFLGRTLAEVRDNVLAGNVQPIPRHSGVPGWLARIILRGLASDPAARFPSMEAMLAALARKPRLGRRVVVAALAIAAVAVGVAALVGTKADPCRGAAEKLSGVWDAGAKARMEKAFLASGRPYAADSLGRAAQLLDGYAASWTAMRTDACRATSVREEQSAALLDARMACLDRRLDELGYLSRNLSGADAAVVDRAVPAALALEPIAACSADRVIGRQTVKTPEARAAQQRLAQSRALLDVGSMRAVNDGLAALIDGARRAKDPLVLADTLIHAGKVLQENDPAGAVKALEEAVSLAAEDDDLDARALVQLLYVESRYQNRGAEARALRPAVEAAVRRAKDERQRVVFLQRSASLHFEDGQYEAGLKTGEEALALADKVYGTESLVHAELLLDRARGLGELGKREEATATAKRALAMVEKTVGPEHPAVKAYANVLGEQAFHVRDFAEAKAQFSRVLHVSETVDGPNAPAVAASLNNLAMVAVYESDYTQAEAYYRRALALAEKRVGPDHPDVASGLYNLAILFSRKGQPAEALPLHQRALAIREKALPPTHPKIVESLYQIGDVLDKLGRPEEGIPWLQRSMSIADQALPAGHPWRVRTRVTLAKLYTDTKRPDEALAQLAAAEKMMAGSHDRLPEAYLHFEIARALRLGHREPARALTLMTEARATFATFPSEKDMLAAADRFLAGR